MHYTVIGTSHQHSKIADRERLAFSPEEIEHFLPILTNSGRILEAALLSTCNRTEIYMVSQDSDAALSCLYDELSRAKGEAASALVARGFRHDDRECVRHLLRVASGLESQMLGEGQILNQVKTAYRLATEAGTAGLFLNRLFQIALQSGKQVRSQTGLGFGGISVGSAAAELLFRHMPQPGQERATVVLLGAGEMAEAAVMQLMAKKHSTVRLRIASRSRSRAQALAERVGGESFAWDDLANVLADATAVIAATSAAQPVLRPGHFARRHPDVSSRPLLCLDLGLPRNIDAAAAQLSNVVLYDLDHINGVIDKNLQDRLAELPRAENILNGSLAEFDDWQHSLRVVPIIKNLRRISDEIRQGELERNRKNFKPEEWEHLDALTASLVNKLLHTPIKRLKELASDTHNHGRDLEAICEFFTTGENLVSKKTAPWHATE